MRTCGRILRMGVRQSAFIGPLGAGRDDLPEQSFFDAAPALDYCVEARVGIRHVREGLHSAYCAALTTASISSGT